LLELYFHIHTASQSIDITGKLRNDFVVTLIVINQESCSLSVG